MRPARRRVLVQPAEAVFRGDPRPQRSVEVHRDGAHPAHPCERLVAGHVLGREQIAQSRCLIRSLDRRIGRAAVMPEREHELVEDAAAAVPEREPFLVEDHQVVVLRDGLVQAGVELGDRRPEPGWGLVVEAPEGGDRRRGQVVDQAEPAVERARERADLRAEHGSQRLQAPAPCPWAPKWAIVEEAAEVGVHGGLEHREARVPLGNSRCHVRAGVRPAVSDAHVVAVGEPR
jgi:hypothetical protein